MAPRPPRIRTRPLALWMLQVAQEARGPWSPGRVTATQQEALLQAEHNLEEWRIGAPRAAV
eukprot:10970105-Alexandrium_andersonii.AAC.1